MRVRGCGSLEARHGIHRMHGHPARRYERRPARAVDLKEPVEVIEVVNDPPVAAALLHLLPPGIEP
jgi:hypothetical protein